jgi:cytochrome c peroxidase
MIFTGSMAAIILVMAVIYRFVNIIPPNDISKDAQAIAILNDASCLLCHQKNHEHPLYAGVPVLGDFIRNEAAKGYRRFDIGESMDKLNRREAVNEAALAKIEMATVIQRNMPPTGYYLLYWGASVTPAKQKILKEWIRDYRERFYPNPLAVKRFKNEPVRPLPPSRPVNGKAALGRELFHDVRLSHNNTVSCASCHHLNLGGADNRQFSGGVNKIPGSVNTPTVFNACFNVSQFRDGRAPDLKAHAAEHILDPLTMAAESFHSIIKKLLPDNGLYQTFDLLYRDGVTESSIIDAIVSFEKTLVTPNCRFDSYLKGKSRMLNDTEIRGYDLFKANKCATCHAGVILGGLSYERMDVHKDYFEGGDRELTREDLGRFNQTGDERDCHRFKVPGLRNVALTKPYFHDGSQQTLYDAVKIMGVCQSGRSIRDRDVKAIVSFLETLTGEYEEVK